MTASCNIYVAIPAKYPAVAPTLTFLAYQIKSTFSKPISATPLAEPITKIEPPVPAQSAINCQ